MKNKIITAFMNICESTYCRFANKNLYNAFKIGEISQQEMLNLMHKRKPSSLGEGLKRVKVAMGAIGKDKANIPGVRKYAGKHGTEVEIKTGYMERNNRNLCESSTTNGMYNIYCGSVLEVGNPKAFNNPQFSGNEPIAMFKTRFISGSTIGGAGLNRKIPAMKANSSFQVTKNNITSIPGSKSTYSYGGGNTEILEKEPCIQQILQKVRPTMTANTPKYKVHHLIGNDTVHANIKLPQYGNRSYGILFNPNGLQPWTGF